MRSRLGELCDIGGTMGSWIRENQALRQPEISPIPLPQNRVPATARREEQLPTLSDVQQASTRQSAP